MKNFLRRSTVALFAVTSAVTVLSSPAAAAPVTDTSTTSVAKADAQASVFRYAVRTADYGVVNTANRVLASVSGSAGKGTLSINRSESVSASATFTGGIAVSKVKADLGISGSYTVQVQISCSYETGGRAATLTAYPRSRVVAYKVYERILGSNNDRYVGSGQFYQPVGFHCQLRYR